jgi:hypothetical protein
VQEFKRVLGHLSAPSAFDFGLILCLLGMAAIGFSLS